MVLATLNILVTSVAELEPQGAEYFSLLEPYQYQNVYIFFIFSLSVTGKKPELEPHNLSVQELKPDPEPHQNYSNSQPCW
jgi:hypothetical protein